jgi:hypothetical protein
MTTPKKIKHQRIKLLPFQESFVNDISSPHIALVGGLGTGKTKAAVFKTLKLLQENRGCNGIGCEPTGPQLDIFTEEMNKTCAEFGIKYSYRGAGAGHPAYYEFDFGYGKQLLRLVSAKNYKASLVGYNAAFGFIDEADTIENKEEGKAIWYALNDRLRDPKATVIQSFVTSTPEGYHTIYDIFVATAAPDGTVLTANPNHRVIQVSTFENIYLKPAYVEGQLARYTPQQAQAKIYGKFVNSFGQRVYDCFDRTKNTTTDTLENYPRNILHVGMDFNIGQMSATVSIINDKQQVMTLDEITGEQTTDTMIAAIKRRYPGRAILIYPDTNGKNRSANSNADETSINKLKNAFGPQSCFYKGNNPSIFKERVPAVNAMFKNAKGEHRSFVNLNKCPVLVKGLEQQGYISGKPDKSNGLDHCLDAFGYFMHYRFPIIGQQGFIAV